MLIANRMSGFYYGRVKEINFDHNFLYKDITKTSQLLLKHLRTPYPRVLYKQTHKNELFWSLFLLAIIVLKFSWFKDTCIMFCQDWSRWEAEPSLPKIFLHTCLQKLEVFEGPLPVSGTWTGAHGRAGNKLNVSFSSCLCQNGFGIPHRMIVSV